MKQILYCMLLVLPTGTLLAQDSTRINAKDLQLLTGCWSGSITYLDYTSGKAFSMPAKLQIAEPTANEFVLSNIYPEEPKANGNDTLTISADGRSINEEMLKSVKIDPSGETVIITEKLGKDGNDNKPALLRHIYSMSKTHLVIRKEVQFVGTQPWVKRNEFSYARVNCN
jgi:hypothetical protein